MGACEGRRNGGRFVLDDMWAELTLYGGNLEKTVYSDPAFGGLQPTSEEHFANAFTASGSKKSRTAMRLTRSAAARGKRWRRKGTRLLQ